VNGNEVIEMGGNWYEKSVSAHLYLQQCSPARPAGAYHILNYNNAASTRRWFRANNRPMHGRIHDWRRRFFQGYGKQGWLGSRVVSVLDSGTVGPGFKSQPLSGNSLRQTVHTHRASVHHAAKLVAALLRVARVTAGLAESDGSLPPGLPLTSPTG